jgi:hypothetical protein
VVGRGAELAAIREFVIGIPAGPCTLLVEGAVGIGKTTLWRAGLRAAQGLSLLKSLPAPQQHALEVAVLRREASADAPVQPRDTAVAALGAIRMLARSAPVLIAIDDAQWLDAPSARVVAYAVRRLEHERIGLLMTRREGTTSPFRPEQLRPEEEIVRLEIPPLTLAALHLWGVKIRLALRKISICRRNASFDTHAAGTRTAD